MASRPVARAARRLADQTSARLADTPTARLIVATVVTVTAGASPEGNALVQVSWRGETYTAAGYAAGYTPAPGHRVRCELVDNQLLIAYRILT
jgi:hypothetical protein